MCITKTSTRSSGAGWCDQSGLLRPLWSGEPIRDQGRSGLLTPGHARSTIVLSDSKRSSSSLQGRLVLGWRGKTLLRSVWGLMRIGVISWVLVLSEKKSTHFFCQNLKHTSYWLEIRIFLWCEVLLRYIRSQCAKFTWCHGFVTSPSFLPAIIITNAHAGNTTVSIPALSF